jgi:hypothetical protein
MKKVEFTMELEDDVICKARKLAATANVTLEDYAVTFIKCLAEIYKEEKHDKYSDNDLFSKIRKKMDEKLCL